jgi:hypothetical protein
MFHFKLKGYVGRTGKGAAPSVVKVELLQFWFLTEVVFGYLINGSYFGCRPTPFTY